MYYPFLHFSVNCEWKEWTAWESCSVTCGNGTQKRTRTPYIAAKYGGLECKGIWHKENDYEYNDCSNDEACSFNCKKQLWINSIVILTHFIILCLGKNYKSLETFYQNQPTNK